MNNILFITASYQDASRIAFETAPDIILILKHDSQHPVFRTLSLNDAAKELSVLASIRNIDVAFIAKEDQFNCNTLMDTIQHLCSTKQHTGFTLLIPYKAPPTHTYRLDGRAGSFLMTGTIKVNYTDLLKDAPDLQSITYCICQKILNSKRNRMINVYQVGRNTPAVEKSGTSIIKQQLSRSLLVIPHKGPVKLLKRCLQHLNQTEFLPGKINLCFDDHQYQRLTIGQYERLKRQLNVYVNNPLNVGPYPARHYSALNTSGEYIFFQDSDDISVDSRFRLQIEELTSRKLDMIGSHELRIDELKQAVMIVRFPVDVNAALEAGSFLPLFHPTSVITKKAYKKAGGFSTDLKFGYDAQFTMRCFFFLKMGNMDEFLYIRFRRKNSLTTKPKTKMGSGLRNFLLWRWSTDFRLIREKKLDLLCSSLSVYKHRFAYSMEKLTQSGE